jgi:hypothetical protein
LACARADRNHQGDLGLCNIAITVFGLIALSSPLFLWLAWNRSVFWVVLALGCGAVLALFLLVRRLAPGEKR